MVLAMVTVGTGEREAVAAEGAAASAMQHFRAGQKHYNLSEFGEALREFKEAYRIKDDPAMLFNIAQCQWKLGDLRTAVHSYRAYLRMGKDPPNRAEVENRIQDLENRLKSDEDVRRSAEAAPVQPLPTTVENAPAEQSTAPASLPAAPEAAGTSAAPAVLVTGPATPPAPAARPLYRRWWFWTALGVVVVAAAAGGLAWATRGQTGDCSGETACWKLGGN